ncbi:hypothetical protein HAX54_040424 [Datura stramonium]|uniref:Uncharacterized protein n=1 Tax=Datura stramonium TaxID=4076 RepID=A0ABS8SKD7_DATST|nr:hypothetical protein [Datura stramonium]
MVQEAPMEDASMPQQPLRRYRFYWITEKEDSLRRAREKKGQRFSFRGLLTQFLRVQHIEKEVVDYRPRYGPNGLDLTKIKESEGIYGPVLSSLLMMMTLLMMRRLKDSDLESDADGRCDSKIGEAIYAPTDNED